MMNIPTSVLGDMTKPVMRMGYLIQAMGQRMMALVKRNTGKHRQAQYMRGVHHHQPYINYHGNKTQVASVQLGKTLDLNL